MAVLITLFYIIQFICIVVRAQNDDVPESELAALHDLYTATDGANWSWQPAPTYGNEWNFTANANPCTDDWQGVTCSEPTTGDSAHVVELVLPTYNLIGRVPNALGNLTYLTVLSLPNNFLSGPLPDSPWSTLTNLTYVDLTLNGFTGTIPASLEKLSDYLITLDLSFNELNGTIPEYLGNFSQLAELHLEHNHLTGTIPPSLGSLTKLLTLRLFLNQLQGTIPEEIGGIQSLQGLLLFQNQLTGTVPASLSQLVNLTYLVLNNNQLNGTLPTVFCELNKIEALIVAANLFTGTVPSCLGSLSTLHHLDIGLNYLEGTIPDSFSSLAPMIYFSIADNYISGTIPAFFCTFSQLGSFYFYANSLEGTIPGCVADLSVLENFGAERNDLTGTVPSALAQLANLTTIWLSYNYLSGPIPPWRSQAQLTEITMFYNEFTGTIPDHFDTVPLLIMLEFGHNYLTGTLPASIGGLRYLLLLDTNNNLLTGTVPPTYSQLHSILELYIQTNFLHGTLESVFNGTRQVGLANINVEKNQFSGNLPEDLFQLPFLNSFVALGNCFTGTLPVAICDAHKLVSLILDGLHTSPSCRTKLLSTTHAYEITNNVHGTIPPCLFSMPTLVSLYLSGNELTGSLPSDTAIAKHLIDLSVSHNALTGTIPATVQEHNWRSLDLSYNRLTGGLQSDFGAALSDPTETFRNETYNVTGNTVSLQNNRLSGRVPSPLVHLQNLSMLGSNMFSCDVDKSDLPKHDSETDIYQCGSDDFNAPFYVALLIIVFYVVVIVACNVYRSDTAGAVFTNVRACCHKWSVAVGRAPEQLRSVIAVSDQLCLIGMVCTALIVVVLVPWYAAATHYYGTYSHQYAWVVSAAFLSGLTPAVTEFVLYGALVAVLVGLAMHASSRLTAAESSTDRAASPIADPRANTSASGAYPVLWRRIASYVIILTVNMAVVGGVNAGFVAAALTQSTGLLILGQILLSAFKLLWNAVCTPALVGYVSANVARTDAITSFGALHVFLGLFNNIAIPCLVVAALSPSCLYSVFDAAPPVNFSYVVQDCYVGATVHFCTYLRPVVLSASYNPPFAYSYQCSSSFITYYAAAFVYLGLAAGVVAPLAKIAGMYLLGRARPTDRLYGALKLLVPRLLAPVADSKGLSEADVSTVDRSVFSANTHVVSLTTYLGILLTFGVVFPPLAVVMCATMLSVAWQTKLSLGRYLAVAQECTSSKMVTALDKLCKGAVSVKKFQRNVFLIVCFCCCFYALFLFDTLGDQVGPRDAYWVLIVMPLLPLAVAVGVKLHQHYVGRRRAGSSLPPVSKTPDVRASSMEMQESFGSRGPSLSRATEEVREGEEATYNALQTP